MSKKRFARISVSIWNDAKFQELSTAAKLVFFFLLTTQHLTLLGLVPIQKEAIGKVCGLTKRQFASGFDELVEHALIEYDDAGLVWLCKFFKHNPPANLNVVLAWGNASDLCPECALKEKVLSVAGKHCLKRGTEYVRAFLKIFPDKGTGMGMGEGSTDDCPDKDKKQNAESRKVEVKRRELGPAVQFPYHVLPEHWREKCLKLRRDLDPYALFEKMLVHYTMTAAKHEFRTKDEWTKTWAAWVTKELV